MRWLAIWIASLLMVLLPATVAARTDTAFSSSLMFDFEEAPPAPMGPAPLRPPAPALPLAPPEPEQSFAARPQDSVGKIDNQCVATVWKENSIITANHCVVDKRGRAKSAFQVTFRRPDGRPYTQICRRILRRNQAFDYAIVECPGIGRHIPVTKPPSGPIRRGDPMLLATHDYHRRGVPLRVEEGRATGVQVLRERDQATGRPLSISHVVMRGTNSYPGNSGSLTFDRDGRPNALLSGGPTDSDGEFIPGITYLIPMDAVHADLQRYAPSLALEESVVRRFIASVDGDEPPAAALDFANVKLPEAPRALKPGERVAYKWNENLRVWEFAAIVKRLPPAGR